MGGMNRSLLYVSAQYPNAVGDAAFVQTEMRYLSQAFSHIVVLSEGNPSLPCVAVPANVTVLWFGAVRKRFAFKIVRAVPCLFHWRLWWEFLLIARHRKPLRCFYHALGFLSGALFKKKRIVKTMRMYKIDVLYTFWYYNSTLACLLALKHMGLTPKPMCTRTHGFDLYELRDANRYQPFKIQMDREVDRIFFISRDGMEYYRRTFAARGEEVYRLCYLGTENALQFEPHPYTDEIRLLSVSNVVPVKRIHLIVEALAECAALGIKIRWTHIGDGTEMQVVRALAEERLAGSSVQFCFLGQKTNAEVHDWYRSNTADLFVNMSESEGLPVSMMEAMSYGVPVAAPDVGGIGEIVDEDSGWLLSKDGCRDEFVGVIRRWAGMTAAERHRKAERAYKKWDGVFNAEKNYRRFAEELRSL